MSSASVDVANPSKIGLFGYTNPLPKLPMTTPPTESCTREQWVTPQVAAASLSISRQALMRQIAKLELEGVARRDGRRWWVDQLRLPEAWPAVVRGRRDGYQPVDFRTARAISERRKLAAQAELAEMELAEKRASLVPMAQVEALWTQARGVMRDVLEAAPARITARLAEELGGAPPERLRAVEALLAAEMERVLQLSPEQHPPVEEWPRWLGR